MGWDNAGGYNRQHNFSADASSGIKILAVRMDTELDDFASAMTLALTRNGQNVPTVNLPMGGFRHINVGAPTSVNNYMRSREFIENVPIFMQDQEASADRISVSAQYFTSVSANQAPGDGTKIIVRAASDKSSAVLYLNGHSANVEFQDGNRALNAMVSGGIYEMLFSSADVVWKLQNPDDGRTSAERAAGVTPTNYQYPEGHVYRYGTNSTPGTTDMTSALQSAALVSRNITIPEETILVTAVTPLLSNTVVSGGGYRSHIVTTTANLTAIFTASDKSNIRIENIRLEGSDAASASTNGTGIYFTDCDDCVVDRCWFTLFGSSPIRIQGDDAGGHDNFVVSNCFFFGNAIRSLSPSLGGELGEVCIAGGIRSVRLVGCRFEAHATVPYARGIFIANNGATLNWTDFEIDSCYFNGYANNGIGSSDEDPGTGFDNGIFKITNNTILNCVEQGIKIKSSFRAIVTGNYVQDCDATPETAGSLQGSIFINCCQHTICSHNIVVGSGTDGIRVAGLATGSGGTSAGLGRASMDVCHNIIEDSDEAGVFIAGDVYEAAIDGNNIRNSGNTAVRVNPGSSTPALSISVSNNNVRGTLADTTGILIDEVNAVMVTGNRVKLCSGFGILVSNCDDIVISSNIVMDNGVGGTNTSGIRLSSCNNVVVAGNRAGNDVATDQDYGLDVGASVTRILLESNDFSDNQIAATLGMTRDILIGNNYGTNITNNNATAAQIAAIADVINTAGKFTGKQVFDTTNGRLMIAIGAAAGDQWYIADGSGSVTPS